MVEAEVLIASGAVMTAAFVLWRERAICRKRVDQRAREDKAETVARELRVTAVDVPPMSNFMTAETALDLAMSTAAKPAPKKRKKATTKRTPRKAPKKSG